jgi:hypothetical protein
MKYQDQKTSLAAAGFWLLVTGFWPAASSEMPEAI